MIIRSTTRALEYASKGRTRHIVRLVSTTPQAPTPQPPIQTPLQSHPPPPPPLHPSTIQPKIQTPLQRIDPTTLSPHPAPAQPGRVNDNLWFFTTVGSLIAIPFISYYYYGYRKEQMDLKKHRLLEEARERYRVATHGG
ncbi:hypothetical protein LTR62_002147 [Meristemomyces frigidus]|uniref:Uncharacterized protein n=1 Tax=Meristemomyces frigidus TaxID=1508187 RepID=A0AAN7YM28_9PEZI|nr:hypothetical protein LTR62_002147 [Meristemomyces frigidus]